MNRNALAALVSALVVLAPAGVRAQAREDTAAANDPSPQTESRNPTIWQVGTGFSFSSGDYGGTETTEVISVPLNLRVQHGGWTARLATSFVSIDGPASVIDTEDGDGGTDGGSGGPAVRQNRSGLSDVSLALARRFDLGETTRLTGEVRFKFPTGSESKRLSTGTTDVTLRARLSHDLGDVSLRAGVQRRFSGGQGRVTLRDTWGASAGASLDLGDRWVTGVDLDWQQSGFAGNGANVRSTAFVSAPLSRRIRLTGYGATGLSRNSADVSLGVSFSMRID